MQSGRSVSKNDRPDLLHARSPSTRPCSIASPTVAALIGSSVFSVNGASTLAVNAQFREDLRGTITFDNVGGGTVDFTGTNRNGGVVARGDLVIVSSGGAQDMYPNPDAYLQSFGEGEWDIVIAARVLVPADKADCIADLWVISLVYVAAPGKEFPDIASVDKAGVKIGVIRGVPSDHVLTREIKAAEIVRIPLNPTIAADAADLLRSHKADVFGADSGVGYPVAEALPGATIVPGAFAMVRLRPRCRKAALPQRRPRSRQF
jgi:hypothetical protein